MAVGDKFGSEMKEFKDPMSGCRIVQLTDNGAHNRHLYFYTPTFTADGSTLLYISERNGSQQYYRMDLETGESIQLTDLPGIFAGGAWYVETVRSIFFWQDSTIMRVDIDTLECEKVHSEPMQGSYLTVSADGRYVAYALPMYGENDRKKERVGSELVVFDTQTARRTLIDRYPFVISHLCFGPLDPTWFTFCWEGPWRSVPQRIWFSDVDASRGGPLGPQPPRQARGHEFFFHDGCRVGFHGSTYDESGKDTGWFFGHIAPDGTDVKLYWTDGPTGHCQAYRREDGTLLVVCDVGGDRTETDGYISLIMLDEQKGKGTFHRLHSHGSSWVTQGAHPHPQFRPGGRQVVFTTDRKGPRAGTVPDGKSNVYLIEVPV